MSKGVAKIVTDLESIRANAFRLADAINDGRSSADALGLVTRGRVFFPFRYGNHLAFAPAKFIAHKNASVSKYAHSIKAIGGGQARIAISKIIGRDAIPNEYLDKQLENYCISIGVKLHNRSHSFWVDKSVKIFESENRSAINDIEQIGIGNPDPEYRKRMQGQYERKAKVRTAVLKRANGICEACGQPGFLKPDGSRYLEGHHVIKLSEQGPDQPHNVIALCANDHRRAHFGADWKEANDSFLEILQKYRAAN